MLAGPAGIHSAHDDTSRTSRPRAVHSRRSASGSRGRSRSRRPRRCRRGRPSPPAPTPSSRRPPAPARRLPPSCGRSTASSPSRRPPDPRERTLRLVYISPLKALGYDVERNLRAPLRGIGADVRVGVRTGDTPQRERAAMLRTPPDVLITTPESLYLMLTSQARALFAGTRVGHRRRDPRGGADQARLAPRA